MHEAGDAVICPWGIGEDKGRVRYYIAARELHFAGSSWCWLKAASWRCPDVDRSPLFQDVEFGAEFFESCVTHPSPSLAQLERAAAKRG